MKEDPDSSELTPYEQRRNENMRAAKRVTIVSLVSNVVLTIMMAVVGLIFFNVAMLSSAAHSSMDTLATALVLIATIVSRPSADRKHNYGKEKREQVIVLLFSLLMFGMAAYLIFTSIMGFIYIEDTSGRETPMLIALIAVAVITVVAKEALYHYTNRCYKKTKLDAVRADALGHRADGISSLAVLIGIVASIFIQTDIVESIAVLIVALFMVRIAVQVLRGSYNQLVDKAASDADCAKIRSHAAKVPGVASIDELQTRMYGDAVVVDIEIGVDETLSVAEANEIIEQVEDEVESIPDVLVKDCNIHINPVKVIKPKYEAKQERINQKRLRRKQKLEQKLSKVR